jgi:hypothetical protein
MVNNTSTQWLDACRRGSMQLWGMLLGSYRKPLKCKNKKTNEHAHGVLVQLCKQLING